MELRIINSISILCYEICLFISTSKYIQTFTVTFVHLFICTSYVICKLKAYIVYNKMQYNPQYILKKESNGGSHKYFLIPITDKNTSILSDLRNLHRCIILMCMEGHSCVIFHVLQTSLPFLYYNQVSTTFLRSMALTSFIVLPPSASSASSPFSSFLQHLLHLYLSA